MGISIFAKESYLDKTKKYLKRGSSLIRGGQIAEALGAKLNPVTDFQDDVCIYVKPEPDSNGKFNFEGKRKYLDIVDGESYLNILKDFPDLKGIVCSEFDFIVASKEGLGDRIVLVPQHHCNYTRETRKNKEVKVVGSIGNPQGLKYTPPELISKIKEMGFTYIESSNFFSRDDVINFYRKIDIQICWRPWKRKLGNPLKVVNSASFGIPTVALDEPCLKEMGNSYIGVSTPNEMLTQLENLRSSNEMYKAYSKLCLNMAEKYHIDNIVKIYKML